LDVHFFYFFFPKSASDYGVYPRPLICYSVRSLLRSFYAKFFKLSAPITPCIFCAFFALQGGPAAPHRGVDPDPLAKTALQLGLRYVYVGNGAGYPGSNTYCHRCKKLLIERQGYFIPTDNLVNGHCKFCGTKIPGVWHADSSSLK